MSTQLRLVVMAAAIFVLATAALAASDDRFHGGSYDGWCRDAMSEYAALIFRGTTVSIG